MATILHFEALFLLANLFFSLTSGFQFNLRHTSTFETNSETISELEILLKSVARATSRLKQLSSITMDNNSNASDVKSLVEAGNGEFLAQASIGDIRGKVRKSSWFIMDTGSNLAWTFCKPCNPCVPQHEAIFNPKYSRAFSFLHCRNRLCIVHDLCKNSSSFCGFGYGYGDGSYVKGFMALDTLNFRNGVNFTDFAFGCVNVSSNLSFSGSGIMALGRNSPSLISQLAHWGEPKKFSYRLPHFSSKKTGSLLLGSSAKSRDDPFSVLFPLLINNVTPYFGNLYYVDIIGISVGCERIMEIDEFTFEIQKNGSGGIIFDSGTSFTYLLKSVFDHVVNAFKNQSPSITGGHSKITGDFDSCIANYTTEDLVNFPNLVLHATNNQSLHIPGINNLYTLKNQKLACLAYLSSPDLSIFGNYQQQGLNVLYDLRHGAGMLAISSKHYG